MGTRGRKPLFALTLPAEDAMLSTLGIPCLLLIRGGTMSRLVEKLTDNNRMATPLGFQTRRTARSQPKLMLVAVLGIKDLVKAAAGLAGADAGLLKAAGTEDIEQAVAKLPDLPWGGWLEADAATGPAELTAAGADFIVFPLDGPAGLLPRDSEAGQFVEISGFLDENWLRSVAKLPLDVVLFGGDDVKVTWRRLMQVRYCVDLVSKPVFVMISPDISEDELAAVWSAGADGVAVTPGSLAELRKLIDGLEPPAPRRKDRAMALLPRVSAGEEDEEIEEPGDD
jgi:hypothetical protein